MRWHDRFMPRRVLLVDDNSDFRSAARQLLERHGFLVVAEAETGITGIEWAQDLPPAVAWVVRAGRTRPPLSLVRFCCDEAERPDRGGEEADDPDGASPARVREDRNPDTGQERDRDEGSSSVPAPALGAARQG